MPYAKAGPNNHAINFVKGVLKDHPPVVHLHDVTADAPAAYSEKQNDDAVCPSAGVSASVADVRLRAKEPNKEPPIQLSADTTRSRPIRDKPAAQFADRGHVATVTPPNRPAMSRRDETADPRLQPSADVPTRPSSSGARSRLPRPASPPSSARSISNPRVRPRRDSRQEAEPASSSHLTAANAAAPSKRRLPTTIDGKPPSNQTRGRKIDDDVTVHGSADKLDTPDDIGRSAELERPGILRRKERLLTLVAQGDEAVWIDKLQLDKLGAIDEIGVDMRRRMIDLLHIAKEQYDRAEASSSELAKIKEVQRRVEDQRKRETVDFQKRLQHRTEQPSELEVTTHSLHAEVGGLASVFHSEMQSIKAMLANHEQILTAQHSLLCDIRQTSQ